MDVRFRLDELVARLGGELVGEPATTVRRVATLDQAGEGDLAFLANPKYQSRVKSCRASAVILAPAARDLSDLPRIIVGDPYSYFARVAQLFNPPEVFAPGVHPGASVASPIPSSVTVAAGASIDTDVELGEQVVIGAGSRIGRGVRIGSGTRINANVTVYHDCVIGAGCIVHAGAVIGSDGFGFARERDGSWIKIPQVGRVVVGDDVEIGANTTIDRGALDDTVIGNGVKLDNQIQIGHNVRVGDNTAIAGCVGVAGSTTIGARCMIGGQAGIIGHLRIADDVVVSSGTLVTKSITRAGVYTANLPVQGHGDWVKNFAHLRHLDALVDRIRALEQRLEESTPE
ncbi:UDP-3-O-(3-hydroxymyristoyl)glucosamine N-acyltransferase [Aromatoleum diolicum]|uniref:UDP-3-O-acylglucosamine N-acyltransferase n=1 Tax=Aromatoleum diolicum TaxID=75796 RepID=A0ABX1Q9G7_9RHOO|nr:UDP-3-O-(3-hydroxymyristoyl)glucosamine N-acyltransferase [Aromatoleum diolicum]NMG75021.1 UDP-3-O-(3-hydroxymyristoyl)glucosamine N-acyltransferase [Aromatoleum diolicum]